MVLPTFQNIDFSQDFILTCAKNPIIGEAIANNLKYRSKGESLFFLAVQSYMHSVSKVISGKKIDRGDNPEYFKNIRNKINECDFIETYLETGPGYHTLFRDIDKQFNLQTFEKDKADFYNEEQVTHWNVNTQKRHESIDLQCKKELDIKQKEFIKLKDEWQNFKDHNFLKYVSTQLPKTEISKNKFNAYNTGQKIAIVSLYTKEIADYAVHSENSIRQYCEKQNYTFYVYREKLEENSSPNWSKSQALLNHIDDHDYIVWMDSDTLIFNP